MAAQPPFDDRAPARAGGVEFPLPSRERPFDKRSGGPIAEQWEGKWARACVAGREMLYAYCAERGVPHKRLGKLIVACEEIELALLEGILAKAAANGVEDLEFLGANALRGIEPALAALGGLISPSTGI